MTKILYSTAMFLAFTFSGIAQEMYDSFDDIRTVTYGNDVPFPEQLQNGIGGTVWPGWHGTFLQYYLNPGGNDINNSNLCARYDRNPGETYDVILVNCGELADLAPYLAGDKTISMDIYSPVPGVTVQFSLQNAELSEGGYPQGRHSEYQAVTTTGGQWETLEFSLTGQPWSDPANAAFWPDANTANNDVDQMVLLFQPGLNITETYYFDNIMGPERATPACTEYNVDTEILMDADCENDRWFPTYYDGRMSIFPDPALDQDDNCIEYARNGGAPDDVVVGEFNGALNIPPLTTLSIDIYDPAAPSAIVFSLQDEFGTELLLGEFTTTGSLQWETFEIDLAPLTGLPNVTNFVILIEPGQELAETFYLDNLILETEVSVEESAKVDFEMFPNPANTEFSLTWEGGQGAYTIFDARGAIVAQNNLVNARQVIPVDGLANGMYTVSIVTANGQIGQRNIVIQH